MARIILDPDQLKLTIQRLAHQLTEDGLDVKQTVFIGIQPRGIKFADRVVDQIRKLLPGQKVQYGKLDITFYRDDVRDGIHLPNQTSIDFSIEGKTVILIDDVLYTGRTIRSALDALQDFGRPARVALCALIDRRFSRELPIQPDFCGKTIDSIVSQRVIVEWEHERVVLHEGAGA
ncbi:bifunctional pyr operon transcriptional regulator/uracil phosphoribosyltransferase PyrR [Dinghuibacter silviterrae]|uniref:Pyrimidine operon attenuation protein/uracil phosphoribosyltransferase n=1 Tax=Dinghuibacter silviterrae TaxID=1539049 RepID=A0A4R8DHQ6_9BACT|nr:bifunctional pyr operon transcriptional regulator/uracil phosphoribosyltransferase PyrR [Dinghuibacter silviterrae]TDW97263.1 pyrimidine operon attenuation protein/uracil phosphoribosyltransferase [Dinghuibacter silviterrae]